MCKDFERNSHAKKKKKIPAYGPLACGSAGKESPAMQETCVRSLGWEDALEKGKATHSSILAWRIPWTIHGLARSLTQLS